MKGDNNANKRICDRAYLEKIMDERCRLIDAQFALVRQRFDAGDAALTQAKEVLEFRLHSLNQLRELVDSNTREFLRTDVYNAKTERYDEWIEGVNRDITVMKTKSIVYASVASGAMGVVIILVDILLHSVGK